jgi:hypothetical protein
MPITDILDEGDELTIRVAVLDSLGNLQYFPGEDGDTEIVGAAGQPIQVGYAGLYSIYQIPDGVGIAYGGLYSVYQVNTGVAVAYGGLYTIYQVPPGVAVGYTGLYTVYKIAI